MTKTARNAIVRGQYVLNRGPGGGRSYAGVKGFLNYLAFGGYADHLGQPQGQRSLWVDHNEQPRNHGNVLRWAKDKVHRYGYGHTYQLLLSTRHGGLDIDHYNRVLKEGSSLSGMREWVYAVHEDTDHQHAHAILFRKEKLSRTQYREWQTAMQDGLERALSDQARFSAVEQEQSQARVAAQLDGSMHSSAGPLETDGHAEPEARPEEQTVGRERGRGAAL